MAQNSLAATLADVCRNCDALSPAGAVRCVLCGRPLDGLELTIPPDGPEATVPLDLSDQAPVTERVGRVMADLDPPFASTAAPPDFPTAPVSRAPALAAGALPPGWGTAGTPRPGGPAPRPPGEIVVCPQCQARNPPAARYCGSCGAGLSPAARDRTRGTLVLVRGFAGESRQFPLTGAPVAAGRTGPISFPEDPYVGATHATFFLHGDEIVVRDEGAPNGIYVRLREPQPLRAGDFFSMGEHLLRYAGLFSPPANPARHGSPRTSDRFHVLEEILEGGGVGRVCKRAGPVITIGRAACDLSFPTDGFISARHAELAVAGDHPYLRDVGSANGTFLRVPPHSDRVLHHGDYLLLGRELLRVEVAASR